MEIEYSIDEIQDIARKIITTFPNAKTFAFYAEMGSGKTTFIKALCTELGVKDNVSSPTFSIINEYQIDGSQTKIYHMDWYRLKNTRDAIEAGVQDILEDKQAYCFIEWPEIAEDLLDSSVLRFSIRSLSEKTRMITDQFPS